MRWFFPIVLGGLICPQLAAQALRFQQITTEQGLSDNAVTCVFEDRAGFIWIGTQRGLNRYDGQRVETFTSQENGPRGVKISSIAEDARGDLWITTVDGGLSRHDHVTDRFVQLPHDSLNVRSPPTDELNHVLVLNDSVLVLSSRGKGAIWYHLRNGMLLRRGFREPVTNAQGDTILSMADHWVHAAFRLDERRLLLTMLASSGPCIVDALTGERTALLANAGLVTHATLSDSVLFMGGWSPGLFRARPDSSFTVERFPIEDEITAIIPWDAQRLLLATKVGGLLCVGKDGTVLERYQHTRHDASSLLSDRVTCLLRDRAGDLWVGTTKGLSVFAPAVWRCEAIPLINADRAGDLEFHAVQQDDDGTVRISTSKGFLLVDPVSRKRRLVELFQDGLPLELTGLFRTAPDEFFAGTETGIFRYDPRRERILRRSGTGRWESDHANTMFQTRAVWSDTIGGQAVIICGALGYGHIALDRTSGELLGDWVDHRDEAGTMMLRTTLRDAHGTYWSATAGGVVRWRPVAMGSGPNGTVFSTRAAVDHRLPGDDAQGLAIDGDTVWVALRDAGLASIVDGHARAHPPPVHMPHDMLGVTVDTDGRVWCTTGNGLLRYDPRTNGWLHVPVNDGREFRQLGKCITTLRDGRIAFCADDHLLLIDPKAYNELPELPAPRIVGISNTWGSLEVDAEHRLELPFRNSAFDAMVTALQPVGAAPLTFLYRLDDEGTAHREVGAREPLRFSGVAVGTHRLLVRVRDAYGREGPEYPLLTVTVIGPFWQRWWFFLIVLGAGALGMYLVSRFRLRQRARLQHVRDRIARDLHDDIGSTLGSISFYSEALKRKLSDTDDIMARQITDRIGASSREMIDQMNDIVWSVDPKNDDAGALSERLRAFASDLLAARGIALDFRADEGVNERKLSAEQRRNVFLISKELLHNTVKYADARQVNIMLATAGRSLELTIGDDGKGFDPDNTDSYDGNGLPNMRARAAAVGAEFTIDSAPGKGTRARIVLAQQVFTPRSGD